MTSCSENYVTANGVRLCWFEWGAEHAAAGTILLVHATGFHARCWDQTIAHMGKRHVIAVDMRGHGRSEKQPPYTWDTFGTDLTAFICELDLKDLVAAGHSMGGHSLCQALAAETDRFSRIVLVDPVIMSREAYAQYVPSNAEDHPVSRRRNRFDDAEAMYNNLKDKGSYHVWEPEVLHDYCQYGLLPNPDGPGFVLACPPVVEASIYTGSVGTNIYPLLERMKQDNVDLPVTVLRAREREPDSTQMDFSRSPTWPGLAGEFVAGKDVYLPELTHFLPMQVPALVAGHITGDAA